MAKLAISIILALFVVGAAADMYLHNPRGSNDRNCERNQNRNNANRLFDSQNNDQGGYACPRAVGGPEVVTPRMYYYAGSKLRLEWTNQHGCGTNDDTACQVIFQYMCQDANPLMTDGIPDTADDDATDRMDASDLSLLETNPTEFNRYGYHETYDYWNECFLRQRNQGLWTSDENVNNNVGSTASRQNANGDRYGWECQEERDYYPYWHPSPWKDIAILTSFPSQCSYYQQQTENVLGRGHCLNGTGYPTIYNNPVTCAANAMTWVQEDSHNIAAPDCTQMYFTRSNHLGNVPLTGDFAGYWWTIPSVECSSAVLRVRYNISNAEIDWNYDFSNDNTAIQQDPFVQPFSDSFTKSAAGTYNLSYAVNADQYGRTFQDRSYIFSIKKPSVTGNIINLNVRGKRGNIVQTFPAVEYDFTPQHLDVFPTDLLHIQWIGSDYNPNRQPNNGVGGPTDPANPGTYRADRSNMVQMNDPKDFFPMNYSQVTLFKQEDIMRFAYINQDLTRCLNYEQLTEKNGNDQSQVHFDSQNCMKLNAALTPYFDGGVINAPQQTGTYWYYSTRNTNFSNRQQKGSITVKTAPLSSTTKAAIGISAGVVGAAGIAGGSWFYAKKNPTSQLAKSFQRFL